MKVFGMVRKAQMYVKMAKVFSDALGVMLALLFSGVLVSWERMLLAAVVLVVGMAMASGYRLGRPLPFTSSVVRITFFLSIALLIAFCMSVALATFFRALGLCMIYLLTTRILIEEGEVRAYRRGLGQIPVLVVGMSRAGEAFLAALKQDPTLARMHVLGFLDNTHSAPVHDVPYFGKLIDLEERITSYKPQAVIQVGLVEQAVTMTAICQKHHLEYFVLPSLIGAFGSRVRVNEDIGLPLIGIEETTLKGWGFAFKRLFDVLVSLLLVLLASPVMLVVAFLVAVERKSLHVFVQEMRVDGRANKEFALYRFRTLQDGKEEQCLTRDEIRLHSRGQIVDKSLPDATPLGALLRRTELNELPQLFNVLKNNMSIVGPRPPFPEELPHYTNFHHKRLRLKPGLTGMWQVYKGETKGTLDDLLRMDVYYVEHWSLGLDAKILAKTVLYVLRKLTTHTKSTDL